MEHTENPKVTSRLSSVLTDVHFWVPLLVLIGGLLLLQFMH